MNSTSVTIDSVNPVVLQSVHDYFTSFLLPAFWGGAGLLCGIAAGCVFIWMIGRAHE